MVKSILIGVLMVLLISPLAFAAAIDIEAVDRGSTVISELNNPASFDLVIDNQGATDNFQIFSLIGLKISPSEKFSLFPGKTLKNITAYAPDMIMGKPGLYLLEYQIKGDTSEAYKDKLKMRIALFKDTFEIKTNDIRIDDSQANLTIRNIQNANLNDINMRFKSDFFDFSETFSLKPYQQISFMADLDRESLKKLVAGPYVITASTNINGTVAKADGIALYLESSSVSTTDETKGILIRKHTIVKTNEGNIPLSVEVRMKKDIISRLFTSYSLDSSGAERGALVSSYSWIKEIGPQESLVVTSTTNYTLPVVIIALIIAIALMVKVYTRTEMVVKKRVSYVKTRGGEFALKVFVQVKARKNAENVNVIDRIPPMAKLYEQFVGRRPDKIDEEGRRLYWSIPRLNAGEERVFSYIVYSKMKVIGRFELPPATAVYHTEKGRGSVDSNRTYFVAEMTSGQ